MYTNPFGYLIVILVLISSTFSIRLPEESSYPIHYSLNLDIDVDSASYTGNVAIRINVTSANTNLIALNYHDIQVDNVIIFKTSDNGQLNLLDRINPRESLQIIEFYTKETLTTTGEHVIQMDFQGAIRSDLKGLYMSSYWINGTKRNLATTFFAPHYARMVFPCYDEPHFKATFDVQITNNIKYHALANAKQSSYNSNSENITTAFERTPKMSTYLLAFIVSDLVPTRDNSIAVWSQSSKRTATEVSLKNARLVVNVLEAYLGLSYQMNKLDLVAVDDFLMGAMENWGLITFASGRLLADELTTAQEQQRIVKIVSHEIVHQYFGNLVTCKWWNEIWLNEGFATYLEDVIADKVANQWLLLDQYVINEKIPAMRKDADRINTKAMNQNVTTLEGISSIYDFVAYPKAGSIIRMFHHVVGDQIFQETLRQYLKTNQYANVESQDFYSVLEAKAKELNFQNPQGISLSQAFGNWAGSYGFPLVTVLKVDNYNMIQISQKRFIHSNRVSQVEDSHFFVPFKLTQLTTQSQVVQWLTPSSPAVYATLNEDSWFIVNPNAFGYYRVNYEELNWNKLSNALRASNTISISSRVQLIDDVMTVARFGHTSYSVALNLIEYIKNETHYIPVATALGHLDDLARNLRPIDVNINGLFYDLLDTLYKNYILASPHLEKLLEVEVKNFACRHAFGKCITDSHVILESYVQNKGIDTNLRKSMFCGCMQSNGEKELKYLEILSIWKDFARTEPDRLENERQVVDILDSFGCLRNESLMEQLLTVSVQTDSGIFMTTGDRNRIFGAIVSGSEKGTDVGLSFLKNNWSRVIQQYGSPVQIYNYLSPNVVTASQMTLFNEIVFTHMRKANLRSLEPRTYEAAMAAVRQVEENHQFIMNHGEKLKEWFDEHYPGSSAMIYSASAVTLFVANILLYLFY